MVGQEMGVDVRLALDVIHSVYRQECDVVVLFSRDQDLSEVAGDVRLIAKEQGRWMKIAWTREIIERQSPERPRFGAVREPPLRARYAQEGKPRDR